MFTPFSFGDAEYNFTIYDTVTYTKFGPFELKTPIVRRAAAVLDSAKAGQKIQVNGDKWRLVQGDKTLMEGDYYVIDGNHAHMVLNNIIIAEFNVLGIGTLVNGQMIQLWPILDKSMVSTGGGFSPMWK